MTKVINFDEFMHLSWHGQYTIKIVSKDIVLLLDPYSPNNGLAPLRSKADILGLTNPNDESMSHMGGIQGSPIIVNSPGEYSLKGMTLYAFPWTSEDGTERSIQRWDIEEMSILHLGALNRNLSNDELSHIERTDIEVLILPIGGGSGLTTTQALALITTIEPRVVIPIHYALKGLTEKLEPVDKFAKEMGVSAKSAEKKVILKASKLPHEDMQTILLQP